MKAIQKLTLVMALLIALTTLAGCAKDPNEVVGLVGETPIYHWEYEQNLAKQVALYEQYYGADVTKQQYAAEYAELKQQVIDDLVGRTALKEEARSRGLYDLTDEQKMEIDQQYNEYYQQTIAVYIERFGSDEKGMRKAEQAFEELMKENSLNEERVRATITDNYVSALLMQQMEAEIVISDEEVRAQYDKLLAEQQAGCAENIGWLGENLPPVIVYVPEGYVKVLRLAKKFNSQQMQELQTAATSLSLAASQYFAAVQESGENGSGAKSKQKELDRATLAYESLLNSALESLHKTFQADIMAPLQEGADFMKLMNEKSEDINIIPYYVCKESTQVEETFRDAALQLQNPGDISEIVNIVDGVCVVYLDEKLEAGVREFSEVDDQIRSNLAQSAGITQAFQLRSEYGQKAKDQGIVTLYGDKIK